MNITKLLIKSLIALILILSQAQATSKTVFYHHDALGSIVSSTGEDGEILWKEEYQPYGEKINDIGNGDNVDNPDWYTGKNYDKELDISYFGARWYDAKQGRFLSIDPVGVDPLNLHSFNRYAYANNNPYAYVDPDGRVAIKAYFVPTGGLANQKMKWRLNVKLTTTKFNYYADKFGARNLKGILGKAIMHKVVGPRGDGDNASNVVEIDSALEENGLNSSLSSYTRDIDPKEFIEKVNGLSKKNRDLFKAVHGQNASQMVKDAKNKYHNSFEKKVIDRMSKNVK